MTYRACCGGLGPFPLLCAAAAAVAALLRMTGAADVRVAVAVVGICMP